MIWFASQATVTSANPCDRPIPLAAKAPIAANGAAQAKTMLPRMLNPAIKPAHRVLRILNSNGLR